MRVPFSAVSTPIIACKHKVFFWKDFDNIYKIIIYLLLHCCEMKVQLNFVNHVRMFAVSFSNIHLFFGRLLFKMHRYWHQISGSIDVRYWHQITVWKRSKAPGFSNFREISQILVMFLNFSENNFREVIKLIENQKK